MKEKKIVVRGATPEELVKKWQASIFAEQARRLKKIERFKIPRVATIRVFDHVREARESYINGCYRSCIICSSNAVEQTFIHMLIVNSEDWEKTYWEIKIKKWTFGKIIEEAHERKIQVLAKFIKDARWIRDVRNAIVAHPSYIAEISELKNPDEIIWANKIMLRDLHELLQFFDPSKKKELESQTLTARRGGKIIAESEPLESFLKKPIKIEVPIFFDWLGFQAGLLINLAEEVYGRMSKIINGIHKFETQKIQRAHND